MKVNEMVNGHGELSIVNGALFAALFLFASSFVSGGMCPISAYYKTSTCVDQWAEAAKQIAFNFEIIKSSNETMPSTLN